MHKIRYLFALAAFGTLTSRADTIEFVQGGWSAGGPLAVSFKGHDSNVDGRIDLSELSGFHADFWFEDGSETNWSFSDLQAGGDFAFSGPSDFLVLIGNADWTLVNSAFEGEVLGSIFDQFLFPLVETQALPVVTPEPSSSLLFALAGVTALIGAMYRSIKPKLCRVGLSKPASDRPEFQLDFVTHRAYGGATNGGEPIGNPSNVRCSTSEQEVYHAQAKRLVRCVPGISRRFHSADRQSVRDHPDIRSVDN